MSSGPLSQGKNGTGVVLFIHFHLAHMLIMSGVVTSLCDAYGMSCSAHYLYLNCNHGLQNRDTIRLISTVIGSVTCTSVWSPSNWMAQLSAEDVVSWLCNKYEYHLLLKFTEIVRFLMLYFEFYVWFSYTQYDLVQKPSTLDVLTGYFTPSHV
jgi:hypothetical protein